jgi:hypothetical protein
MSDQTTGKQACSICGKPSGVYLLCIEHAYPPLRPTDPRDAPAPTPTCNCWAAKFGLHNIWCKSLVPVERALSTPGASETPDFVALLKALREAERQVGRSLGCSFVAEALTAERRVEEFVADLRSRLTAETAAREEAERKLAEATTALRSEPNSVRYTNDLLRQKNAALNVRALQAEARAASLAEQNQRLEGIAKAAMTFLRHGPGISTVTGHSTIDEAVFDLHALYRAVAIPTSSTGAPGNER